MATNQILDQDAVAGFLFSNASEYDATDLGDLENTDTAPTAVQFDPAGSVTTQTARQSTKADLGATHAAKYAVTASFEFATAPVSGETVDFYWAPSHSGTAGKGNMGQTTGVDGVYAGGAQTLAEGLKKLIFIGSLVCSTDATTFIQTGFIGVLSPPDRFGNLVAHNNTSDDYHSDGVETAVAFEPIVPQIQADV